MGRLVLTLFLFAGAVSSIVPPVAEAAVNAGFVQGFWYSSDTVFADLPTRIYVAIRNNTGGDLTGTITFYDNKRRLGSQAVTALDNRIIESWVDWTPHYGEHALRAELTRVNRSTIGSTTEPVDVALGSAEETLFVDVDTDRDHVGNNTDTDDDADGISDEAERARGSDPLVAEPVTSVATAADSGTLATTTHDQASVQTDIPSGLERYLTPSRVDRILSSVSETSAATKAKLDAYRTNHTTPITSPPTSDTATSGATDGRGFGAITRSAASTTMSNGIIATLTQMAAYVGSELVTLSLFVASWLLGHPGLVQVLLLFVILFIIYQVARRFGRRPHSRL